jgi:thiamine-phosphate pyrophosphorylase
VNALQERLRKYFVMGSQDCEREPEVTLLEAIEAGITTFQYREKGPESLRGIEKIELGKRLREICRRYGVLFIVNDNVELANDLEADGIHVGQEDMPVEEVRKLFPDKLIGLSVSSLEEVERSRIDLVDYVGAGPVYETGTKPGQKPTGLSFIKEIRRVDPMLPIVAIGGIKPDNAKVVRKAGADGLAVVTAITKASSIKEVVQAL